MEQHAEEDEKSIKMFIAFWGGY